MPGDQSGALAARLPAARAATPRPGPARSARAGSAAPGGWVSGVIAARRLPGAAHREARRRVAELAAEGRIVVDLGLADREAGRRALLPVVAEGRAHEVADRLVAVGQRGDDDRVLAAGLGEEPQVRPPLRGTAARSRREPVRITASTRGSVMSPRPTSSSGQGTNCRTSRGIPASQSALGQVPADQHGLRRGLEEDRVAAASAASTPPAGIESGKFHGGATTTTPSGIQPAAVHRRRPRPRARA